MELPNFDGSEHISATTWVQKMDAYLQLNPMEEGKAIQFATLYLMGKAHEWWFYGMTTLGHGRITSYQDSTQRLIDRFDREDPDHHSMELTKIKQTGSAETFIEEFQKVSVMVPDVSESKLLMMYIEELIEPVKGWVKYFKHVTLQDVIECTKDLVGAANKNRFTPKPPIIPRGRDTRPMDEGKGKLDEATRRDLRRKQLCFTCKEPWKPSHRCLGKGTIHYIEVMSDSEEETDDEDGGATHTMQTNHKEEEEDLHAQGSGASLPPDVGLKKVTIASMSGVPKFNTFWIKGVVQGQRATVLIDGGASYNFIDMAMVERRHIPTVDFEGFLVEVVGGRTIACDTYIPQMSLTLGRYTLAQEFYVVDIPDQGCRSIPAPVRTLEPRSERERPETTLLPTLRTGASRNHAPPHAPALPNRAPDLSWALPAFSRSSTLPLAPGPLPPTLPNLQDSLLTPWNRTHGALPDACGRSPIFGPKNNFFWPCGWALGHF
jgi:hypothetical protein